MAKKVFFLIGIVLASLSAHGEKALDLGTISRLGTARTVPVYWMIGGETIVPLTERALSMNGGLLKVGPDAANVLLEIRQIAGGRVQLLISGTHPQRVLYEEVFEGGRATYLALKACDRAVEKILGTPGFYTGKLAFISDRTGRTEVYVSDLFLQNIRQITSDRSLATMPHFSPDGKSLTYTSYYRTGYPDVFKIDLATGRRSTLAAFAGLNTGGAWSPLGNAVALVLSSPGNPEIYISDAEGRRLRRLTRTYGVEASPSFSPDGAKVVFASDIPGRPQIYQMDIMGGPINRVPTNVSGYCAEPQWNPRDPNQIIFTAGVGKGFQIAIYDFIDRKSKILTRGAADGVGPCWLSDGRHVVYTRRTGTSSQLCILDTQTGRNVPLTSEKFGKVSQASFAK